MTATDLRDVAAGLGSDVPYFLAGGTAFATGRGTDVTPLGDLPPTPLALALPEVEVSTAWAYGALAADRDHGESLTHQWRSNRVGVGGRERIPDPTGGIGGLSRWLLNDLEGVVFRRFPVLGEIKQRLLAHGASHALMTGSGSAVFGVFESSREAGRAAQALLSTGIRAMAVPTIRRTDCGVRHEPGQSSAAADQRN